MSAVAPVPSVVPLRDDQEEACGALLARAFFDDPIFRWVEPDDAQRARFLAPFFTGLTRRSHRLAVALATAGELEGASLWKTPGLTTLTPADLAMTGLDRIGEWLSDLALARLDAVFVPVEAAFAEDVPEPVWYLGVLGVEPGRQGRGIGSRLMAPVLERADRESLAVTLETAQPKNLPLYERHGFRVLRDIGRLAFGMDMQCAQCHDHPLVDDYYQADYYGLYAFVQRTAIFLEPKTKQSLLTEKAEGETGFKSVFTGDGQSFHSQRTASGKTSVAWRLL